MRVGFEKALRGIERDPRNAEKIGAYLLLVGQEKNADNKAEAFANLAQAVFADDPVAALDHIESAFKIAPHNTVVLRVLVGIFERRGRRDAADAVRAHGQAARLPIVHTSVGTGGTSADEDDDRAAPLLPLVSMAVPAAPPGGSIMKHATRDVSGMGASSRSHFPSLSNPPDHAPAPAHSPALVPLVSLARLAAPADPAALARHAPLRGTPREAAQGAQRAKAKLRESDLCRALLRDLELEESLLHAASEFVNSTHSVVGLVHFCHYLVFTGRIGSDANAREAIAWVKEQVVAAAATTKARARFQELLEPLLNAPRERR